MKLITVLTCLFISTSVFSEDIYLLKTDIGGKVFNDIFVYEGCTGKSFEGSITVPGIFTAKVEEGRCGFTWVGENVQFKILVKENNQENYVFYAMRINRDSIGGVIRQDGEIIGTIQGTLIHSSAE